MRGLNSGLIRRLRILYFWLVKSEAHNRVRFLEVLIHLCAPRCEKIATRFSICESEDDRYIYYNIKGFKKLFTYPKDLPYHNFAQVISEGLQRHHWHYYEIPQTRVHKGDIVVDCGSAEGFFAFKYIDICKHIYVIEPLPAFCQALHDLFDGANNVTIIEAALSNKAGTLYMSPSSVSSTCKFESMDSVKDIRIQACTLDSIFAEKGIHIDYLKADLEGFEENMVLGALETIKMSKPRIAITTYHSGQNYQKLIDLIKGIVPEYRWIVKGIEERVGNPVMLHMWVE